MCLRNVTLLCSPKMYPPPSAALLYLQWFILWICTDTSSHFFIPLLGSNGVARKMSPILQLKHFSWCSFEEKHQWLTLGTFNKRGHIKLLLLFFYERYQRRDWLCGCAIVKRLLLFCFLHLLFGGSVLRIEAGCFDTTLCFTCRFLAN